MSSDPSCPNGNIIRSWVVIIADPVGHGSEVISLQIPCEHGLTLPAYLVMSFRDLESTESILVIVNSGGFDSTQDEL